MNFKVDVWAGRTTAVPHEGNNVATTHHIAHFDEILLVVCIPGDDTITMGNFNHLAVAIAFTAPADDAAGNSDNV